MIYDFIPKKSVSICQICTKFWSLAKSRTDLYLGGWIPISNQIPKFIFDEHFLIYPQVTVHRVRQSLAQKIAIEIPMHSVKQYNI